MWFHGPNGWGAKTSVNEQAANKGDDQAPLSGLNTGGASAEVEGRSLNGARKRSGANFGRFQSRLRH